MDSKIIRAGINSAILALLSGAALGTFGGWGAIFELSPTFFGVALIAVTFSTLLGYVYSYWFAEFFPGTSVIKGALFGILVWIVFLILGGVSTFFKDAVYAGNSGEILFFSLINHCVWGSSLSLFLDSKN